MSAALEWARPAGRGDLTRLRLLWGQAEAEIGLRRGGRLLVGASPRPPELDSTAGSGPGGTDLAADPDRLLVVGGIDEVVLGFAAARVDRAGPAPVALLQVAFVEEAARGVGVGEAMIELVVAWASEHGCSGVDAYALPGSRDAKAFYEDHGFVARLLTMHLPLRAAPPGDAAPAPGGVGAR